VGEPLGVPGIEGVALGPARRRGDPGRAANPVEVDGGACPDSVEAGIQDVEVLLLGAQLARQVGGAQRGPFHVKSPPGRLTGRAFKDMRPDGGPASAVPAREIVVS